MKGKTYTEYSFEMRTTIKVTVRGCDTPENEEKARFEAIKQAKKEIDEDWIWLCATDEYDDYDHHNNI